MLGFKPLKDLPSDYVREHIYFTVQYERVAIELRQHVGVDRIMFATDFPHIECEWPNSRPIIDKIYADVPDRGTGPHLGRERRGILQTRIDSPEPANAIVQCSPVMMRSSCSLDSLAPIVRAERRQNLKDGSEGMAVLAIAQGCHMLHRCEDDRC